MLYKKLSNIVLVLILLVSTMGVTVHKHYSGKHLYSKSLFVEAKSCCEVPCDCCHKTTKLVQVKEKFVASHFQLDKIASLDLLFTPILNLGVPLWERDDQRPAYFWDTSPPLLPDLCILHQVFRL